MKKFTNKAISIASGLAIGFINGFFGGGGGMIAVPVLERFLGHKTKTSHATAMIIILPISIVSAIIYLPTVTQSWDVALWVGAGSLGGGIAGAILLSKIKNKVIRIVFALIMVAAGVKLAFFR